MRPFVAFWGKWKEDQNSTNQWSVKHQKSVRFTVLGAGKQRVPPKAQLDRKQICCGWMTMGVTLDDSNFWRIETRSTENKLSKQNG
jgi:hypothetical protein